MTRRTHPADRGLAAVARVREVRERDSRLGLVDALADLHALVADGPAALPGAGR